MMVDSKDTNIKTRSTSGTAREGPQEIFNPVDELRDGRGTYPYMKLEA